MFCNRLACILTNHCIKRCETYMSSPKLRLKEILEERGISAYRLAKDSGIDISLIHQYKHNRRVPRADNLRKIAKTLNVPMDDLFVD